MTDHRYTCTLSKDMTDFPRLGARDYTTGEVVAAFYNDAERRLFIAAPDLLLALERLTRAVSIGPDDRDEAEEIEAYAQGLAAITKATKARGEG